ncbi:putative E3 ubiquitin-protein ligase HERC1 [Symbiodinium microadriaticum]|uniref:Putative E3 ubiquitin-protein ligase HERC1 n=1 Tax=Symbiodinium microadriaticum TaxID=2951 RepID=A0A1Q9EGR1_SYMMI|nr:putative E3 ubiquitin-protein ligase HERC1 [Symbiodinium microadriaticum]
MVLRGRPVAGLRRAAGAVTVARTLGWSPEILTGLAWGGKSAAGISAEEEATEVQANVAEDFGRGWPHASLLGGSELKEALTDSFQRGLQFSAESLNYGDGRGGFRFGHPKFLTALARFLEAQYQAPVDPATLMTTAGSSMGTDLALRAHARQGDICVFEEPSYYLAFSMARDSGLECRGVPILSDGIDLDMLEDVCKSANGKAALEVGTGRLVDSFGSVLDSSVAVKDSNLRNGDFLTLHICQLRVSRTAESFATILGDGSVVTWGQADYGGDSTAVKDQLKNVQQVQASRGGAFAAILVDGSVVAWGNEDSGGDSSAVQDQLKNVQRIQATSHAFAAVRVDGSVVTWGDAFYGGDNTAVQDQLKNVQQIQATACAFAAILGGGSVVTWGYSGCGGDSRAVQGDLKNVQQIQATDGAFAAILGDGSVVTWGAFAAIRGDGSVVAWGWDGRRGDSSAVQDELKTVQQIQASGNAFAALLGDGSVVTWGDADYGGDSSAVQHRLKDVQPIQASLGAFAAILGDGSVVTWGEPRCGGDSSAVRHQLRHVRAIQATSHAILCDESVVKFVYTIPVHQNPTGYTTSNAKRERLVALAQKYGFLLIADEAYQLLNFEAPTVKPLLLGIAKGISQQCLVECSEQDNFAMLPCSQRGGSVSIPMVGHVTSHVMEPSHVPSEPNTPPALLGREGPPRPNEISKLGLNRVQFLPEHLARYPVSEIPVDQLGLYALEPGHARRLLKYSVFDRQRHHQQRTAAYGWSLNDLVSEAVRSSDERVKVAQVLTTTLPQLAVPQIVLTPAEAAHNQLCVPIDMRPLGGRPCTLLLESGMPAPTVISEAFRVCPAGPLFAPPDGEVRNLFLVDAQGNVWEELPADLAQLQWLRVQGRRPFDVLQPQLPEPQFGPSIRLPPAAATTLTTTWVMEQQNVQTISFILAGLGSTIRLHPQHVSQARVAESIADLVLAMARQRGLPPRARVALVAAQPMPLMIQHIALLFVIYPDDGRRHIILDPSGDGSMAQSISVDEQTRPEELLAEAQRRQNYVISVNGIPHSAMRRCIQTGDYVQVIHSPRRHRVSPTDWYYQIFPDLRLFAFAIEIPRLQRATAAPLDALVQTQVRDGLLRYLHPRLAQQRESMGQPAADTQPVFIHGPGHAPALLYVPGRILPVLAEVEESIHATGLFQPHTTFVDSCQVTHMHAPLFLSVPAGMAGLGVFVPAPAFLMGYHLMWVTAEMDPATLPLPVHRNFILIYPSTLVQAATVRHRRIANNPAATPREASEGTSLLQLPAYAVQRRQAPLREPQVETLPPQTQARQAVIATPLGRRSVHVSAPHQSSVQPSACRPPADDDGKLEQSPRNLKTVVRLSEALQFETAEPSNTKTRIRFGVHREMFEDVFGAFDLSCLHRNWSMVHDLLPASRRFIQQLPCLPLTARPDALQIYVDGSYFPPTRGDTRSGWAICVLGRHADTWCWAGFITRNAAGGNAGTLLDKVASAFTTELAGILHALAICLAVPVEASIGYDCQAAGEVAQGLATAQELTRMPDIALQLFHLLSLQGRRPRMFHLRSHKGHPLNEFCDAAAKAAAKGTLIDTAPDTLHEAAEQNVLDWLWLSLGGHRDIPGLSEEGVLYDADTPQGAGPTLQHALPPMPLTPEESTRLGCRAVTYNCLSCASTFQREALDGQFHKKKCCLVGLQETRTCGPPRGSTAHFFVLASAASEGQLGCQLWLSKSVPLGWVHDVPILWDDKGLSIVFSSPRILATIAKAGSLKFAITVAHAPTSKEAATVRAEWWRQLSAVLRMAPATCTPILLIDGNAQLCQEEAPAASSNRYFFEQVLQEHQLCHSGDRAHDDTRFTTWTGPDGRTAAIDYVCVPLVLQQGVKVEGPLRHFQGLTTHDHSPIAVSLDWSRPAQAAIKTPKLDYSVLAAPDRREWWRQWMSATPVVPWSADVDNHLAHLNKHILAGLTQICPRIRPGARGTITSGATWDAIRDRRQLRRMQHSLAAEHRRAYLRVLFLAWRTGSGTLENSHVARLNIAFIGLQIRAAGKRIRGLARQDAAHHTRDAFVQARGKGPEALHHLLRQVVKVGRKYKKFYHDSAENPRVLSVGTFSKLIGPGLKIGWVQAHEPLLKKLGGVGWVVSGSNPVIFSSMGLLHFVESGALASHIKYVTADLRDRRDFICQKLRELDFEFVEPHGGYFVWVKAKGRRTGRFGESMTIHQEMDRDGNAGVLFERMARALVLSSPARGDLVERQAAARRRAMARALLIQAGPLVAQATAEGLADLSHISMLIEMQLKTLDSQDAEERRSLGAGASAVGTPPKPLTLMQRSEIFCKRVAPVEEAPDEPERKLSRRDSNASSCVEVLTAPDADPPLELRQAAATKGPRPVGPQASAAVGPRPVGPQAPSEDGLGWEIVDQPSMLPKVPVPRPVGPQVFQEIVEKALSLTAGASSPIITGACDEFLDSAVDLGYRVNVYDRCILTLDDEPGNSKEHPRPTQGIILVEVDDLLEAGGDRHRQKMAELNKRLRFGKAVTLVDHPEGAAYAGKPTLAAEVMNPAIYQHLQSELLAAEHIGHLEDLFAEETWP